MEVYREKFHRYWSQVGSAVTAVKLSVMEVYDRLSRSKGSSMVKLGGNLYHIKSYQKDGDAFELTVHAPVKFRFEDRKIWVTDFGPDKKMKGSSDIHFIVRLGNEYDSKIPTVVFGRKAEEEAPPPPETEEA